MKRQEPVLDLSCRGRHPKTVHEEVPMDSLFEIARVVLVAIAHGVTLGVLARRREGDGSRILIKRGDFRRIRDIFFAWTFSSKA